MSGKLFYGLSICGLLLMVGCEFDSTKIEKLNIKIQTLTNEMDSIPGQETNLTFQQIDLQIPKIGETITRAYLTEEGQNNINQTYSATPIITRNGLFGYLDHRDSNCPNIGKVLETYTVNDRADSMLTNPCPVCKIKASDLDTYNGLAAKIQQLKNRNSQIQNEIKQMKNEVEALQK